jgi:enediyne biosynthesis protein E4
MKKFFNTHRLLPFAFCLLPFSFFLLPSAFCLAQPYFQDVTASTNIGTLGFRSTSWGDINNDGHLDLLTSGKLFLNNQNGTFTDITAAAGITAPYYTSAFIDMNNDGKEDVLFLHTTPANNTIYINNGNNTFTGTPLNMGTPAYLFISTISIADVNNDKYPDLFVGQLRDVNNGNLPLKNYFYLNNKNNGFTFADLYPANMGSSSAVPDSTKWETRASMFTDYDLDGDLDLYVAIYRQEQDQLWRNNGNGVFTNVLKSAPGYIDYIGQPVDWSDHGTGCDWADYDNDGDMDLLLSNFAHPTNYYTYGFGTTTIWRNDGLTPTTFTNMKSQHGIAYKEPYAGAAWGDVNADGLPDIYITCFAWYASCDMSEMYIQNANHSFTKSTANYGLTTAKGEADGSFIDFNNDGKLDLATGVSSFNFALFKNTLNSGNNSVQIDLESITGNKMAIGAKVVVVAGGKTYTQFQIPNHGALQGKGNRMYFGLGTAATITSVTVTWPNGTVNQEIFTGLNVNGIYHLVEGAGSATAIQSNSEEKDFTAHVFPNPAEEEINISYFLPRGEPASLEIFSLLGEKIYSEESIPSDQGYNLKVLQVKELGLKSGMYTFRISAGGRLAAGKIIVGN